MNSYVNYKKNANVFLCLKDGIEFDNAVQILPVSFSCPFKKKKRK